MHTNMRTAALVVFALPACALAHTASEASRIGGSIYPTVIQPAPPAATVPVVHAHPLVAAQHIGAVCLASQAHADACHAHADMAVCDVDSVGFSHCLSHYASALVKQPVAATRSLRVTVRDAHGASRNVTVLATRAQSDEAIAKAALEGMPGATIVAAPRPDNHGPYIAMSRAPRWHPLLTADRPDALAARQIAAPWLP